MIKINNSTHISFLSLLGIFILLSSCNSNLKQANKRGLAYIKQDDYTLAITEFNHIITKDPSYLPAVYNRAIVYANTQQYDKAIKDFNFVIISAPNHADSYLNKGIIYENLGDYNSAIKNYTEVIKLRPLFIKAYTYRGIAFLKINNINSALKDFNYGISLGENIQMTAKEAKEIGLNSSALYFNRAIIYQKLGDYGTSIADYDKAIAIDPSNKRAFYNRAIAKLAISMKDEALADLQVASQLGYSKAKDTIKELYDNKENNN